MPFSQHDAGCHSSHNCGPIQSLHQSQRKREIILGGQADRVLLVMELVREAHEAGALELDHVRPIGVCDVGNERLHVGTAVGVRGAEIVVVRIAEGVPGDRAGMEHAEPRVVQAHRPAADLEAARVAPAHKLAENVAALQADIGDLRLDREPLPTLCRRRKVDRSSSGKYALRLGLRA